MNKRRSIITALLLIIVLPACRQVVDWDLTSVEPVLVVEGNISTAYEPWEIQLSMTQDYFAKVDPPVVDDAFVTISDDAGNVDTLAHRGGGVYVSANANRCVPGRTYTLTVKSRGETYRSSGYCREQLPIDTLFYFYFPEKNGFIEPGYYVFELAKEIQPKGDYYWWQIYKNDTLQDEFGYILDTDEFADFSFFNVHYDADKIGNIDPDFPPRPFPFGFDPGDVVTVEQYCIDKSMYDFLNETQIQQNKAGSPFDAPPSNPIGNISNGAFGYFGVMNKESRSVRIP